MSVTLAVDHRESNLKELINKETDVICSFSNLSVGDAILSIEGKPFIVFERKTLADLSASIKDSRYKNQKLKMLETYEADNLCYIIEGSFDYTEEDVLFNGIHKKGVLSCIYNTMFRDKIKVIVTRSCDETWQVIKGLYKRIHADPAKYVGGCTSENQITKGKSTVTVSDCYVRQLCQVPDVSLKTANAIASKFPSFKQLLQAMEQVDTTDEKLKILKDIRTQDTNGKQRRISEKVANNIIQYIL
jgi:crossover junction endonuclease MUS81